MAATPLKIGITGYANAGGSGVVAGELGRLLARRGHEIHFIADAPPFRFSLFDEQLFCHEVAVSGYPAFRHPSYTLSLAAKMAEVARRFELDVLHVHYALPHAAAAILAQGILGDAGRPKLVTTLHGTDVTGTGAGSALYEITRYSIRASDAVTAVSWFLQQAATEKFPGTGDIELIPNFVDLGAYSRGTNAERRLELAAEEEVLLVHLSNFRPVKRAADTVRILAAVNERRPARLLLIGEGPEMAAVLAEGDRLKVGDRIRALGNQVHIQPWLACGDVFLLPSQEESFGLAALEALACGVPAVTSDVGGLTEVIENGRNGYRAEVGDTDSMAARVLEIASDPVTLETYRQEARKSAKRFDAERILSLYEELYRRTLS